MHSTVEERIRLSDYQGKKHVVLFRAGPLSGLGGR
jgi:hypothetical protein